MVFQSIATPSAELEYVSDRDGGFKQPLERCKLLTAGCSSILTRRVSTTGRSEPYEYDGRIFRCGQNRHWGVSKAGMDRLAELDRLEALEGQSSLMWKRYEDEVAGRRINNIWAAPMSATDKRYVVQTANKAIQRCILMTSDPGDLVFDPTCGSGTTSYVAEQWGRRWITSDTSRVAVTLAKQRLMTAHFDYYELARPEESVGAGFRYRSVATVSARTLAYDEPPNETIVYDQPFTDRSEQPPPRRRWLQGLSIGN